MVNYHVILYVHAYSRVANIVCLYEHMLDLNTRFSPFQVQAIFVIKLLFFSYLYGRMDIQLSIIEFSI